MLQLARVAQFAMPMVLSRSQIDTMTLSLGYGLIGVVSNVGLACLVAAVFADRATKNGPPPQFR